MKRLAKEMDNFFMREDDERGKIVHVFSKERLRRDDFNKGKSS
jgi:hypothetical protein